MRRNNILRIFIGTVLVLSVPMIAMMFTDEVQWDIRDFIVIGTLLIGSGLVFELITAKLNRRYRPVIAVVFVVAVLLMWAELAVGIFGSPFAGS